MDNPFNIGDRVRLKFSLKKSIEFDNWIERDRINDSTIYTVSKSSTIAIILKEGGGFWLHWPQFELVSKTCGFVFDIEDF